MPIVVPPLTVPPAPVVDATSLDGIVHAVVDTTWAGVLIRCDFSGVAVDPQWATPFQARVYRNDHFTGEVVVRSGDPALSYDRIVYAYDHEAPLGRAVTYRAVPMLFGGVEGATSAGASVVMPAPAGTASDPGVWCKSLEDPTLSMQLRLEAWNDGTYAGRFTADRILGGRNPATTWGKRQGLMSTMTVAVHGWDEYERILAVIDAGPLLIQGKPGRLRPDVYVLVGDAGYNRPVSDPDSQWLTWTLPITEIDRPPTAGQTLRIPGKSFAERQRDYPTFDIVAMSGRTFRHLGA